MKKRIIIFLAALLVAIPLWQGINILESNLEHFLFWREMAENPEVLSAQAQTIVLEKELRDLKPIRDHRVEELELSAKTIISVLFTSSQKEGRVLFDKESERKLPIASLTKLMTAYLVLENYDLDQVVEISKEAVEEEGDFGNLRIGERLSIRNLLYLFLIESSNDAAFAISQLVGEDNFFGWMNLKANVFGLKDTFFVNSTGLDPDDLEDPINYSTAKDLVKLVDNLFDYPLIWEILSKKEYDLYDSDGVFHHKLINTNELLTADEPWVSRIIGGKTGWTPEAQGCLILILEAPKGKGYLVNVILGSEDRFEDMKELINWLPKAYKW
ncbi:MAG TPA: serine hydrolase [Candidatus Parcubacteria bacterium]|jgi:D-alanyl-D-alanine carboxypeptidase|nr:serine hydrolase [Candidatus Parcubacteria bacterium]